MKKLLQKIFLAALIIFSPENSQAQIKKMLSYNPDQHVVLATGFLDYPPIGYIKTEAATAILSACLTKSCEIFPKTRD